MVIDPVPFTLDIAVILAVLCLTVMLFVTEVLRVDMVAIGIMILLGAIGSLPMFNDLVDVTHLFNGFASNAVISIIAVMIIGAGLDRTGVMSIVATWILKVGGGGEKRVMPLVSGSVGVISGFMQNVGAAALFIPVVSRISTRSGIPISRLLMPMGFCAILGGTLTLVGSSPLILLNDLILSANETLPVESQMKTFGLFSVSPIGFALIFFGILYFIVVGPLVLPKVDVEDTCSTTDLVEYFQRITGFDRNLFEVTIPDNSHIIGQPLGDIEIDTQVHTVAVHFGGELNMNSGRDTIVAAPAKLAIMATPEAIEKFAYENRLAYSTELNTFADDLSHVQAGVAEIVIPLESDLLGKSAREAWLRKIYGLSLIAIHRRGEVFNKEEVDLGAIPFEEGDTIVCYTTWESLARLEQDRNFIVVTTDYPHEELRPQKIEPALFFFAVAMAFILFTNVRLSLCLLIGAFGMLLTRVLSIDEAYDAVSWKTVFLLASLIPLGSAVQSSGTADWIAYILLSVLQGVPVWVFQAAIALLATGMTLLMSNVAATVLLVPLAVSVAVGAGADPAIFALTVAISTSNSFLIPTHQVNALIMGPAGYRVSDYLRVGAGMTVLFLIVSLAGLNLLRH